MLNRNVNPLSSKLRSSRKHVRPLVSLSLLAAVGIAGCGGANHATDPASAVPAGLQSGLVSSSATKGAAGQTALDTATYYPLAVGSRSVWKNSYSGGSSSYDAAVGAQTTFAGQPAIPVTDDGTTIYVAADTSKGITFLGTQTADGTVTTFSPGYTIPNGLAVGKSSVQNYQQTTKPAGGSAIAGKVVTTVTLAGFETVTVAAGTFANAARVEIKETRDGATRARTLYLAPGVGVVKSVYPQDGVTDEMTSKSA